MATGLTVSYTMRLIFYRLSGNFNLRVLRNTRDENKVIRHSMILLGVRAVFIGSVLSWLVFPEPYIICLRGLIKNIVLMVSLIGGGLGYIFNLLTINYNLKSLYNYKVVVMIGSMWFIPFLRTKKVGEVRFLIGIRVNKLGDKGWFEYFGRQGLYYSFRKLFIIFNVLQLNSVKVFMKIFVIGVVVTLFIFL